MALFAGGRRCVRLDADVARVEPGHQALDGTPFTGCVPTLEHDSQCRAQPAIADQAAGDEAEMEEPVLQRDQSLFAVCA